LVFCERACMSCPIKAIAGQQAGVADIYCF
jgi:hypothetical protein